VILDLERLEKELNISFKDTKLILQAFTHSSYVNEHQMKPLEDNERLEFLGDAVLELIVSEYLYEKYPNKPEGELSKLRAVIVCEPSLVKYAKHLNLKDLLLLGKGEENSGGRQRPSLLADAFEAFLGALYLDQGFKVAEDFLYTHVLPIIDFDAFSHAMDYKSTLQERIQKYSNNEVTYSIVEESGPAHHKLFRAKVTINEHSFVGSRSRTKKEAEQRAAKQALDFFTEQNLYR